MSNTKLNGKDVQEINIDKNAGKVVLNIPGAFKPRELKEFYRMFGMTLPVLPESIAPIPMSLPRALELVETHPWRTRVLRLLISNMAVGTNTATLDLDSICDTKSKKVQFNAASRFLAEKNIAIKLTRKNTKGIRIAYQKNTWLLNPKWAFVYDTHEANCVVWELVTGNKP